MKLVCYPTTASPPVLRPAPTQRGWMDRLPREFGYRCLPLTIANSHGWELVCPSGFTARWNGTAATDGIAVTPDAPGGFAPASHFGSGVLTLHPGYLFATEPGYNLWVGGPVNEPRHGIQPLAGVVETDWAPQGFTMNWMFTQPDLTVRFEAGQPFCAIFPVPRGYLENFEPEIRDLASDPELARKHRVWSESRRQFLVDLPEPTSAAHREQWQKGYYVGKDAEGNPGAPDHQIKLRLKAPVDRRRQR